jgi:hypothetical protein
VARRFAAVLWFVLEHGLESARTAVGQAVAAGQLDLLSRHTATSASLPATALPEQLRHVQVEAGMAKTYDALLEVVA